MVTVFLKNDSHKPFLGFTIFLSDFYESYFNVTGSFREDKDEFWILINIRLNSS